MADLAAQGPEGSPRGRKRLRTAHACDTCRLRKIRCNGQQPCESCSMTSQECTFGSEASGKNKSDQISYAVLRSETYIREIHLMITSGSGIIGTQISAESISSPQIAFSAIASDPSRQHVSCSPASTVQDDQNATLSRLHNSTTESILHWRTFDDFPSLRLYNDISFFHLEQSRPPLSERAAAMYPYATSEDVDRIVRAFQKNVSFWYPTMSRTKIIRLRDHILTGDLDNSTHSCLALLLMALGCASEYVAPVFIGAEMDLEESDYQRQRRSMAQIYFDGAMKKIHIAHLAVSTDAAQCLFLAALYFAFLQRPLQAWSLISATATKCRLLLSYRPSDATSDDEECLRRIFWSCYILESDYLAELSALPESGIADIESSIPLPGQYNTHENSIEEEQSSLYFLACLSMRRLLNRVHHLLYAKDTGASIHDARFPSIVVELDHQLEEWRDLLPVSFQFSLDTQPTSTQQGAFLRQRYFTCRSVIYRPYLTWELSNSTCNTSAVPIFIERSKICLDACVLHVLNLRGLAHTVMIDTWICSLSMAGCMLILLAAYRIPHLQQYMGPEVTTIGEHLDRLLKRWMQVPGHQVSPSVEQSVRLILEVDSLLRIEYGIDGKDDNEE